MIAGLDGPVAFMIEVPIHGFQLAGGFVFVGQGIIDEQIQRFGAALVVGLEVVEDEFEDRDAKIQIVPRADAEEVGKVARIDAVEFLRGQLGEGFASWGHDQEIGQAFEVAQLGGREGQAKQADEGDDSRGTAYDGLHGSPRGPTRGDWPPLLYSGDPLSAAPNLQRCSFVHVREARDGKREAPFARVQYGLSWKN